jgi:hypothetical protein
MVLQNDEFKIQDDGIWISKKALEELREHYNKVSLGCDREKKFLLANFYMGKCHAYIDLLKHFEPLEP